jgi:hypothetical protein
VPGALRALSRAPLIKAAAPVSGNRTGNAEKQFSKELLKRSGSDPSTPFFSFLYEIASRSFVLFLFLYVLLLYFLF